MSHQRHALMYLQQETAVMQFYVIGRDNLTCSSESRINTRHGTAVISHSFRGVDWVLLLTQG